MVSTLIAGPCAIESQGSFTSIAFELAHSLIGKDWYLKGSFDKANRSSINGWRGLGIEAAVQIFELVKDLNPSIKITTDIHEKWQVNRLKHIVDCFQIPAFLCRQTDLIVEAAKYSKIVNIKKGQWMSPENMAIGVDKIKSANPDCQAWITERGSQFGYSKLLVDFDAVDTLKGAFDKVFLDCTHSTQRAGDGGFTTGNRDLALKYLRAAPIFGYDGVFCEVHNHIENCLSDKECTLELKDFVEVIRDR